MLRVYLCLTFLMIHTFTSSFFLLSEGFKEAAEKFRVESGIQPNMELDGLDDRIKIRDAVQNGRVEDAISLVNSLHPELLDQDRYLYFHLQVKYSRLQGINLYLLLVYINIILNIISATMNYF